jgi:RNA polymerase sigma-70 factor (ECF subfamily)
LRLLRFFISTAESAPAGIAAPVPVGSAPELSHKRVPTPEELPERLGAVLQVIYLVFNEGYSAAAGAEVTRAELTAEAVRLGRLVSELLPEPEVIGLLSLMLLQESRRAARTSPSGNLILLENQDRSLWNRKQIAEGVALLDKALKSRRFGSYTLQAAIAAVHAEAESLAVTDWRQIVALYNQLVRIQPSPVVHLNRAVAIAMHDGPEAGLAHIDAVLEHGELANYYLAHSARADMYRRLGRTVEARSLVPNRGVSNLCLCAHNALRQRTRSGEEGLRNLLGRQSAHLTQGERNAPPGVETDDSR